MKVRVPSTNHTFLIFWIFSFKSNIIPFVSSSVFLPPLLICITVVTNKALPVLVPGPDIFLDEFFSNTESDSVEFIPNWLQMGLGLSLYMTGPILLETPFPYKNTKVRGAAAATICPTFPRVSCC